MNLGKIKSRAVASGKHAVRYARETAARSDVKAATHICMIACVGIMASATATDALAQMAMPWEGPLCAIATSMQSTVAKAAAVIAIVVAGLALAFGEMNGIFKTIMGLVAGSSMALLATSWLSFLGGGSSFC